MSNRYTISAWTVVALVVLRLAIGWHFFGEGVKHYTDSRWTSEPVLRAARGPLANFYHSYLPDFHGFDALLHDSQARISEHTPVRDKEEPDSLQKWLGQVEKGWSDYLAQFAKHYGLDEAQQAKASRVMQDYDRRLTDWAAERREALATHVHQWQRKEGTKQHPASEVPFQKQRVAASHASLNAEASGWLAELRKLEQEYHGALATTLDDNVRRQKPLAESGGSLDGVDRTMTYVILAVGLLLLLGLFTRAACVAGAVFLFSIISMQPFWVADAAPTYKECVEMFALLALATTEVGRWAGLDYFLSKRAHSAKGTSDASQS